jgi:hypothetical protein
MCNISILLKQSKAKELQLQAQNSIPACGPFNSGYFGDGVL